MEFQISNSLRSLYKEDKVETFLFSPSLLKKLGNSKHEQKRKEAIEKFSKKIESIAKGIFDKAEREMKKALSVLRKNHEKSIKDILKKYERLAKSKGLDFKLIVPDIGVEIQSWLRRKAARGYSMDDLSSYLERELFLVQAKDDQMKDIAKIEKDMEKELLDYIKNSPRRNIVKILDSYMPEFEREVRKAIISEYIKTIEEVRAEPHSDQNFEYYIERAIYDVLPSKIKGISVSTYEFKEKVKKSAISFYKTVRKQYMSKILNESKKASTESNVPQVDERVYGNKIESLVSSLQRKMPRFVKVATWIKPNIGKFRLYFNAGRKGLMFVDLKTGNKKDLVELYYSGSVHRSIVTSLVSSRSDRDDLQWELGQFIKNFSKDKYPEIVEMIEWTKKVYGK